MEKLTQSAEQWAYAHHYDATARFYDLIYAGQAVTSVDMPFYLELAAETTGPVLELGCGTGRVTLLLAQAGHQVVGLDISEAMLAQLRAKLAAEPVQVRERIALVAGDMAELDRPERFALILAPFRAFQHVLDPAAKRECLTRIVRHLAPHGRFVYNAFNPNLAYIVDGVRLGSSWRMDGETVMPDGACVLRRYHMLKPHPGQQLHELWFRYEVYGADGVLHETLVDKLSIAWQFRWEAEYLLELCGFAIEHAYGGYDKRPLEADAPELIFVCRRRDEG